ncbi:unnamed protein product [marine sediment metagenome]|uniref:Uncharacterized protein n=1 Tax=marine sediment metagenome TaxID=412755 RepID=X0VM83_9ZZZZ
MKISPNHKEIELSPSDMLLGSITLRINKDLPIGLVSYKEKGTLVVELVEL